MDSTKKIPSPLVSLLPIVLLAGMLFATIHTFGSDALGGGSQISLLVTTACCAFIGMTFYRIPWKDFERAITNNIAGVSSALLILLIIGALSGIWMVSGVVPTLIYYGMQIIHPDFFLASTCLICALVSVMTGSSWTTIATIGIALMGIGKAQGFHEGWIAGAIISGAYFGDKVSPLSDTTVLASSVTETPLFTHIRYLMITTVPSLLIALILFTVMGLTHEGGSTIQEMASFATTLEGKFNITPWLLLVPIVTGILIARKVLSIVTLAISTLLACAAALIFQPDLLREVAGEGGGLFKGTMMTCYGSTSLQTDNAMLTELVATRGMSGMMNTVWLILCAMCFGGAMTAGGMLGSITSVCVRFIKNRVSTVASTVFSGLFLNIATADQYISIILLGNMFGDIYKRQGYESRLLSRTTEDAVTVTSVLIPWNTCGLTQATILSVPTLTYLPFCFFNYISPLMSILVAATGYKIVKAVPTTGRPEEKKTPTK
ncbi:Na+/H+ antiporter NhaC family protein [uncultured Mediterranea sp.]|uniref:Na+/H+ antiporter NhaC family protein n=1 Tax=uncultured Mediterranea sp. TaxID=1926662 RepID=UPI0027D95C0A|nr:Na+/H+ antiporter NhaC family protein [uncultured Mediterranea sp.]